jgi:hypothetical protein
MRDDHLRIETEDERERLHAARRNGGMCAACGRALDAGETVYFERFTVVGTKVSGPVGRECAAADLLARTAGVQPERCVLCGRGVYYRLSTRRRAQAACSRRCASRAIAARQREAKT